MATTSARTDDTQIAAGSGTGSALGRVDPGVRAGMGRRPATYMRPWLISWLQAAPLTIVLLTMFVVPAVMFLVVSFFDYDRTGIYPAFLLDSYREIFTSASTLRLYSSTFKFAAIVWAITLFLGFCIAYFLILHVRSRTVRATLFIVCALPFFTSAIIRTIAWIPFLGRNGAFNQALMSLGLTAQPLDFLLFSDFAVVVAYVHLYTLLMMGPIANSLAKIDKSIVEAAWDAGASRWQTMVHVVIPLAKTGIALGSVLVVTQVMGDFFVVRQMSGGQSGSIVSALSTEIQAMQFPPAAANAVVLVIIVAIMVGCMMRVVDVRKELVK